MLGRFPLPVEIAPFGMAATRRAVEETTGLPHNSDRLTLRRAKDGHPFVTDGGHFILDAALERIPDPQSLGVRLTSIAGVVEHGLFIGLAKAAILAGPEGIRVVERP